MPIDDESEKKSEAAAALSALGAAKGGRARAEKLSPEERSEIARQAARARWAKPETDSPDVIDGVVLREAKHRGLLNLVGLDIPCYVLDDGQRVIGRTSTTEMLTGIKGGGGLEKYLGVEALKPFINLDDVLEKMVVFRLPEVDGLNRQTKGLPADLLIDVCTGFVAALEAHSRPGSKQRLTARQIDMAVKASMFVSACAKVGLVALIDEATGYQFERAEDALQIKLRAYLSDEMRKWDKTFPDELWVEFARLTGWKGPITKRPKYWGQLVNELVYECMDPDVAKWLKDNVPEPKHGKNYHQWLSAQYGLKKLLEHIWMLIGVAKTCATVPELRRRMAEFSGRVPVQYTLFLPAQMPKGPTS